MVRPMTKSSEHLKNSTTKINVRLWTEDVEFAKAHRHLFPGMSYQALLREMCTQGRKEMERSEKKGEPLPLPRAPIVK